MDEYRQSSQQPQGSQLGDGGSEADDEQEEDQQQGEQQWRQQDTLERIEAAAGKAAARGVAAADSAAVAAAARVKRAAGGSAAGRPAGGQGRTSSGSGKHQQQQQQQRQVLSPADEQLISEPFIPRLSEPLPHHSAAVDAVAANQAHQQQQQLALHNSSHPDHDRYAVSGCTSDGCGSCYSKHERGRQMGASCSTPQGAASVNGDCSSIGTQVRSRSASPMFKTTIAKPFGFEAAATARPKSIAAVKMEQDLAIKAQEEEAHHKQR